jgi:glutamate decarboxylase
LRAKRKQKKPTDVGISVQDLGTSATIGSFEACMFGGLAHKWNWREAGKDSSRPNMVTDGNVQIVWKKFMRYFDFEPRIVSLKPGNFRLTAEHLDKYVDENTICVVAIAGQTFTGEDDTFRRFTAGLTIMRERQASRSRCISTARQAVS